MQTTDATFAASPISEHLGITEEGFLICVGAPIGRTAIRVPQIYAASELGLPGDSMERVYRSAEAVFDEDFLASLEGKPVVSPHPGAFVNADNYQLYAKGHITHPRRGPKLPNGETSLIADLVIYDATLGEQIARGHLRDCSIGYRCVYTPYKDGFSQSGLTGNHLAVVGTGRAEVAIMDSKDLVSQIQEILASVRREQREEPVTQTGSFRDALRACNPAYKSFEDDQAAGRSFADEAKRAGEEMQRRFRPCTKDSAPVRKHEEPGASEDFFAMARRAGARMRGNR
jgi:hypothetical protein